MTEEERLRRMTQTIRYSAGTEDPYGGTAPMGPAPKPLPEMDYDLPEQPQTRSTSIPSARRIKSLAPAAAAPAAGIGAGAGGAAGSTVGGAVGGVGSSVGGAMGSAVGGGAGAGGAAAGGGMGGALAAAGPWAALAAAAILNERQAIDKGRRADNPGEYLGDLASGAVAGQDMKKVGKKMGGPIGSLVAESGRFTEKILKPWEWF